MEHAKHIRSVMVQAPLTAGSTTNNLGSTVIDMATLGGDYVMFVGTLGATSTAVTLTAQASTSTTAGDFSDFTTTISANSTASNGLLVLGVNKPTRRYMRTTCNCTGANVYGGTVAHVFRSRIVPTTNPSTNVLASAHGVST